MPKSELAEAYEAIDGADRRLLLICEHASLRLPPPWDWPEDDLWIVGTHWSFDLGAADITRELAAALGVPAVLSRFSRLLADPNREPASPTLFRSEAEGRAVVLNRDLDDDERAQRLSRFYHPYHRRIDRALSESPAAAILSIHTFTRVYEGTTREVEIGVLFDRHPDLGRRFAEELRRGGWSSALNEPYSGHDGFAYSPELHAQSHGRAALELEIRQDLAVDPERRPGLIAALSAAVRRTYFTTGASDR